MLTVRDESVCLFLNKVDESELFKLEKFYDVQAYKYVGDEHLFYQLNSLNLNWPKPSKKVFTRENQEVLYYSNSGRIRFKKDDSIPMRKKKSSSSTTVRLSKSSSAKIISESDNLEIVGIAGCPSEARAIIETKGIDLITLDIHMPEMNGVEFLKTYLREKKIPTVMISSVSINEGPLVMEALSSGASTYIQKPSVGKLSEVKKDILEKLEAVAQTSTKERKEKIAPDQSFIQSV